MVRHINVSDLHNAGHNARSRRRGSWLGWIPGSKIAVAFLLSLGANLRLAAAQEEAVELNMSSLTTPPSTPPSSSEKDDGRGGDLLADIPPLTTLTARTTEDKISALRLIADSIAQQRQLAARALIFHPATLPAHILLLAAISHLLYSSPDDLPLVLTTAVGVTMAALLGVRYVVQEYLSSAEQINFAWLRRGCLLDGEEGEEDKGGERPAAQEDDEILITKFGDEVIGTLVVRLVPTISTGEGTKASGRKRRAGKGVFRAWTVRLKYRRKGVGGALLVDGVRLVRERLGREAAVVWAMDHANSGRILPAMFNGPFDRREDKARKMLAEILTAENTKDEGRAHKEQQRMRRR